MIINAEVISHNPEVRSLSEAIVELAVAEETIVTLAYTVNSPQASV